MLVVPRKSPEFPRVALNSIEASIFPDFIFSAQEASQGSVSVLF